MTSQTKKIYEFGPFRLDESERSLVHQGEPVALTPRAFDLLVILVQNHGVLLTKDQLMAELWADSFVEEANLNVNISTLRKVLRHDDSEKRYIETVSKKGFRFIADVRVLERSEKLSTNESLRTSNEINHQTLLNDTAEIPTRSWSRRVAPFFLMGTLIAISIGGFYFWKQKAIRSGGVSVEAEELYAKGLEAMERRNAEDLKRSVRFFEMAIEASPDYALAHADLSNAYSYLNDYAVLPPDEIHRKVKTAARRALELDDSLATAHMSLGNMLLDEWDFSESEKEIRRSIELNGSIAEAHHIYSHLLLHERRFDESLRESKLNLELDPHSSAPRLHLGLHYLYAEDFKSAEDMLKETIDLDPNYSRAHLYLSRVYSEQGRNDEAVAAYIKWKTLNGAPATSIAELSHAMKTRGEKGFWETELELTLKESESKYVAPYSVALQYGRLGQKEKVFEYLEKAYAERSPRLLALQCDLELKDLRGDPRYIDLVRRIGFRHN